MSMNVDSFIHHPLFVTLEIDNNADRLEWSCYSEIPYKELYKYQQTQCVGGCYETEERVSDWTYKHNMISHCGVCGVIDTLHQQIFRVDMVLEKNKQLILLVMYYSTTKEGVHWKEMQKYCRDVMTICVTQYSLKPRLVLLNLFNENKTRVRWFSHESLTVGSGEDRLPVNDSDSSTKA